MESYESLVASGLTPIKPTPIINGRVPPPSTPSMGRALVGTIPPEMQLDADFAEQQYGGQIPSYRLMPPASSGKAAVNAAAQSTQVVVQQSSGQSSGLLLETLGSKNPNQSVLNLQGTAVIGADAAGNVTIDGGSGSSGSSRLTTNTLPINVGNTTNQFNLMTFSLPANTFTAVGQALRLTCYGTFENNYTTSVSSSLYALFGGGTPTIGSMAVSAISTAQRPWQVEIIAICTATGSSGTLAVNAIMTAPNATVVNTIPTENTSVASFNTTVANTIGLQGKNSAASIALRVTQNMMVIEFLQ